MEKICFKHSFEKSEKEKLDKHSFEKTEKLDKHSFCTVVKKSQIFKHSFDKINSDLYQREGNRIQNVYSKNLSKKKTLAILQVDFSFTRFRAIFTQNSSPFPYQEEKHNRKEMINFFTFPRVFQQYSNC